MRQEGLETPIIALTANAMKGFERECLEAGCTGYLTKPVDIDALLETLAELLGGERKRGAEPETPLERDGGSGAASSRSGPETIRRWCRDSPPTRGFAPTIEKFVCRLEEKLEAMQACWEARDFEELAKLAHWLKGSGGTVGFDAFGEPAATLELLAKERKESEIEASISELRRLAERIVVREPRRRLRRSSPLSPQLATGSRTQDPRRSKSSRRSAGIAHRPGDRAGRGTRQKWTRPRTPSSPPRRLAERQPCGSGGGAPRTDPWRRRRTARSRQGAVIMMVDDEPTTIEVLEAFLEGEGYENFVTTTDSREALPLLESERPDVLLLDLIMPNLGGLEILSLIRNDQALKHTPVIILTSSSDEETKLEALELGATEFLGKPVDPSELALRLRNTLATKAYQDHLTYYDGLTGLPNRRLVRGADGSRAGARRVQVDASAPCSTSTSTASSRSTRRSDTASGTRC